MRALQREQQTAMDAVAVTHCCSSHGATKEPPTVGSRHPMLVQDLGAFYHVDVPQLCCSLCGLQDVRPEQCGCFPASPDAPQLWFTLPVLLFYHELLQASGTSAEGACTAAHGRQRP